MLTSEQFERARLLALRLAGIQLFERHRELLDHRTRRVGILDGMGLDSLLDAAEQGEPVAAEKLLGLLTTNFTGFFRHPRHFDIAAEHARHVVERRGRAHFWSAGVATGEEAYSLAMVLIEVFQDDAPPVNLLATDIDLNALAIARQGEYSEAALQALVPLRRERFFKPADGARRWSVVPQVRRLVEFRALNLANVAWSVPAPFDVIFCRNVLMYLETCHRYAALEHMASLLAPDGLLIQDPAEHLGSAGHLFTQKAEAVYSRRPPSQALHRVLPEAANLP